LRSLSEISMHEVWALLGAKAIAATKGFTDFRPQSVAKHLSTTIIFAVIAVGMFLVSRSLTVFLISKVRVALEPLHDLMSVVLLGLFLSLNFMSLILSYATLFTSREVEFFHGLPISHRKLFIVRTGENLIASSFVLLLIGTASILGYAAVFQLAWYQYVLIMSGVMLPLAAIAGILGTLEMLLLIHIGGKIGIRWMLAGAFLVYGLGLAGVYWISDPVRIVLNAVASAHGRGLTGLDVGLHSSVWLPHGMATAALKSIVDGDAPGSILTIGALLSMLAVFTTVATFAGSGAYYSACMLIGEMTKGKKQTRHGRAWRYLDLARRWTNRPNLEAIVKRDILQFVRDPVQRIHALMMATLVVITMVFGKISILPTMHSVPAALAVVTVTLFDGFIVASIALRFVFPAVSLEGNAFWCVRSAPISLSPLYWMKFLFWLPLILIPAEALVWATLPMAHTPRPVTMACALAMAFNVLGVVSIHLGAGAFYATQREENPVKVASSQGASVTFLASAVYLLAAGALMILPIAAAMSGHVQGPHEQGLYTSVVHVAALTLLVAAIAHAVAFFALRKDF
jgi:ABC-2 type transport system permease protein